MLARKLLIKPGHTVRLVNAPAGYEAGLELPEGAQVAAAGEADVVQVFVSGSDDIPAVAGELQNSAGLVVWVCYPKGGKGTDLNRDVLWQRLREIGVVGVTLVSVDDRWSAMRVRPPRPGE